MYVSEGFLSTQIFYGPQVYSYGTFLHVVVTTINSNKTTTHPLFIVTKQHVYNPYNDTV